MRKFVDFGILLSEVGVGMQRYAAFRAADAFQVHFDRPSKNHRVSAPAATSATRLGR